MTRILQKEKHIIQCCFDLPAVTDLPAVIPSYLDGIGEFGYDEVKEEFSKGWL